jgi:hypothetical protein
MAKRTRKVFGELNNWCNLMYFISKNGNILKGRFERRVPQIRTTDELLLFKYEKIPFFTQAITLNKFDWGKVSIERDNIMITPSRQEAIEISDKIKHDLKFKLK